MTEPTQTESEQKKNGLKTKTTTLEKWGAKLPLGILNGDGTYAKDIVVRPWKFKEERELGELRDSNRDANMSQYVGMVLATMCSKIGPHNFEDMKFEERRVILGQMCMGDVFYAYVWLRVQTMGHQLEMNVTCTSCAAKYPFTADLRTVEVETAEDVADAQWEYELKTPITIRSKKCTRLILGPNRWNDMEQMKGGGGLDTGAAKAAIIKGSIAALPDHVDAQGKPQAIALAESELDEMMKRDIEALTTQIDKRGIGPEMVVESKCKKCKRENRQPIEWGYDSFFGDSSR